MPFPVLGGAPLPDSHLLRTFPRATDSRKESMIIAGMVLGCVINGDTISSVLEQTTRLTVVICVLIIVRTVASVAERRSMANASTYSASYEAPRAPTVPDRAVCSGEQR